MWGSDDESSEKEREIPLLGGETTEAVVRVGDTVRRTVAFNGPVVHALLQHLEAVGFGGAPRFLGIDDKGREVLSFVEGDVAGEPRPGWISDQYRLASIGRLIRAYHDAVDGFVLPGGIESYAARPDPSDQMPAAPSYPAEVMGHMDYALGNIVFRDGEAVALIDFDLAKPASKVDEIHNAMLHWGPLCDPVDADPPLRYADVPGRCRPLADAYDMSSTDRARLLEVATLRVRRSWFAMKHIAETRGGGWARMWNHGIGDEIKRREAWLDRHGHDIETALMSA